MHAMKCNPIKLLFLGKSINLASFKILQKIGCYKTGQQLLRKMAAISGWLLWLSSDPDPSERPEEDHLHMSIWHFRIEANVIWTV
jgi:hypothetical protein